MSIYKYRSPVHRPERTIRSDDDRQLDRSMEKRAAADEIAAELDDILDDIDAVLEENAEEFVNSYVQKGGE